MIFFVYFLMHFILQFTERKKCIPIDTILWTVLGIWMLAIFCSSLKNAILYVTVQMERYFCTHLV